MNKAVFLNETGGPENFALRDHEPPAPGPGAMLVRNTAIGLNFIDIYQRKGLYPVSFPAILGQEGVGVVEAIGEGVHGFQAGDRVAYLSAGGAYATATICEAGAAAKIPDAVDDNAAAAVFLKGLTAYMLLRDVFPLGPQHACLIYAASGGVGTLLTQWAAHISATVIGVVGSEEKAVIAHDNGAKATIIRTMTSSVSADVRKLTGGAGVDVVYDSVGAATFEASLDALALRGHMVTYGNASGPVPAVQPLDLARRGSLTLTRPTLFHYATPDRLPAMAKAVFELVADGVLRPSVGYRLPLADVAKAHQLLESGGTTGAIVLKP